MATYRGCVPDTTDLPTSMVSGFYCPAPESMYDGNHTFLYYYTTFKYGSVLDPFPATPSSGGTPSLNSNQVGVMK